MSTYTRRLQGNMLSLPANTSELLTRIYSKAISTSWHLRPVGLSRGMKTTTWKRRVLTRFCLRNIVWQLWMTGETYGVHQTTQSSSSSSSFLAEMIKWKSRYLLPKTSIFHLQQTTWLTCTRNTSKNWRVGRQTKKT